MRWEATDNRYSVVVANTAQTLYWEDGAPMEQIDEYGTFSYNLTYLFIRQDCNNSIEEEYILLLNV